MPAIEQLRAVFEYSSILVECVFEIANGRGLRGLSYSGLCRLGASQAKSLNDDSVGQCPGDKG